MYPSSRFKILGLILFVGMLICWSLPSGSAEVSKQQDAAVPILHTLQVGNVSSESNNLTSFITQAYQDPTVESRMVTLNGARTELIQLPGESVGVLLPGNRVAVQYGTESMSLLPNGSSVTTYHGKPAIQVPEQRAVIAVSDVVQSPLENFTGTALLYQDVVALDQYQVNVFFPIAMQRDAKTVISRYTINWGDGTHDAYAGNQTTARHAYQSSGVYYMRIDATDSLEVTYSTVQVYAVKYEGNLAHSYLWAKKNEGPVTLTASLGIGVLMVSAVAFTESGKYRLLMFLALFFPMYTRIQKEDVLDQFVRGQIYGYIKTNPGVHYNQILREIGVKNGTLSYHLGVLEKTQLIKSRREGLKYRAFYPTDMMFPKEERFRLTELQVRIIKDITERPGNTQKEISRHLEQKPQTVNYNIKVLEQAGIIRVQRKGRKTRCYPPESSPGHPAASPVPDEL
jgi:DNA-binding MarR family transcriptional regulator